MLNVFDVRYPWSSLVFDSVKDFWLFHPKIFMFQTSFLYWQSKNKWSVACISHDYLVTMWQLNSNLIGLFNGTPKATRTYDRIFAQIECMQRLNNSGFINWTIENWYCFIDTSLVPIKKLQLLLDNHSSYFLSSLCTRTAKIWTQDLWIWIWSLYPWMLAH